MNNLRSIQFDEAWDIFTEMRSLDVRPDIYTYNILINACSHKQSVSTALELMDIMRKAKIAPDLITYNSLIKVCFFPLLVFETMLHLLVLAVKQRSQLDYSMCLPGSARDCSHMSVDLGLLFLQVMCHCGELDSGLRVLGEMQDAGVQPDVTTFNTLLASASYHVRHLSSISGILEWHGR